MTAAAFLLRAASGAVSGALLFGMLLAGAPARAADEPVTETELQVSTRSEPDGAPVSLDVSILSTDPEVAKPAIVLAHGFGGTKDDVRETGRTLARDGYTVIAYTARGFGRSGGLIHLGNPDWEGADTTRLVDLAATRPEVAKNGDDPVIGFAGASYGGAASILAAGLDDRVDAIAPTFTWHSLSQSLVPQYAVTGPATSLADVASTADVGVFKQRWAALFFGAGGGGSEGTRSTRGADACGRFAPALCRAYLRTAEAGHPDSDLVDLLDRSDMSRVLGRVSAPTLLVHGEQDTLFPLDQADANVRGLPVATPTKTMWVTGGHDAQIDLDELLPELQSWFGRYLKRDGSPPDTSFSVVVPQASLVGRFEGRREPKTLTAPSYPSSGLGATAVPLVGERQSIVNPPGGVPTALTSLPGSGQVLSSLSGVGGYPLAVLPGQSATFTSAELTAPLDLVGSSRIELSVTSSSPEATLFASLWDLGPDTDTPQGDIVPQTAVLPQLAVAPVHLTGLRTGRATTVQVALPAVSHQVPVGHRLRVVVSSTDQAYATPTRAGRYTIGLAGGTLTVPQLTGADAERAELDVPLWLVTGVGLLAVAALAAWLVLWLRRRQAQPRTDLAATPLVVKDLVKTYGDGVRAVDGVTFRAESGQVVGLLGPNGAGKTTTIRMMVGLIRPDSGSVSINGEPVHAGADVLSAVGAFIEGPGFLPHLTGMENLRAYWAATGRPPEEAHLEEALAIAGLGTAIDRRVRGYSHGMRQRLGIAQAMLGLPDLLLLDEPTNGLDPPQIRAMRTVLADYAAAGRTVVVSSHLLAEVERTCSHVVVMHRGRVILSGSIPELTTTQAVTMIGLAPGSDLAAAVDSLARLGAEASLDGEHLRVVGDVSRSDVVERLVADGYDIESVDGRRHLEDVFMGLVGPASAERAEVGV